MKVLWYNTWSPPFITSNRHINNIVTYVLKTAEIYQPDIVILGELFDVFTRRAYVQQLGKGLPNWKIVDCGTDIQWFGQQGSGLFAMYRHNGFYLHETKSHILHNARLQDRLTAKAVIGMHFINDLREEMWVCACHLQDPDAGLPGLCENSTQHQFNETLRVVNNWRKDVNTLIVGDFNLPPKHVDAGLLSILVPPKRTHMKSNKTLDYAIHSYSAQDKPHIDTIKAGPNPSDHKGIVVDIRGFNKTYPVKVCKVDELPTLLVFFIIWLLVICIVFFQYLKFTLAIV